MVKSKRYKCLIRGENFFVKAEDGDDFYNFYTTRFVRSNNAENAENKCLEKLKNDPHLKSFKRLDLDRVPMVHFESISVARKQWEIGFGKGCVWYRSEDADENGHLEDAFEIETESHQNE